VISFLAVGLALLLLIVFYVPRPIERVNTQAASPPTTLVAPPEDPRYGIARDFVKKKLSEPSGARFSETSEGYHLTSLGADRYQVSSRVVVHTASGQILRSWFTVTMRYIGNDRYVLDGKGVEFYDDAPT